MAYSTKPVFLSVTLVLVLLGTSTPKADALVIGGLDILGIVIGGVALCSPTVTEPCTTCAPIPNLRVSVTLEGKEIAFANTASNGSFKINLNVATILGGLMDVSLLKIYVSLPILGCPIWAAVTVGHLEGIPVVSTVDSILRIANLRVPALTHVGA